MRTDVECDSEHECSSTEEKDTLIEEEFDCRRPHREETHPVTMKNARCDLDESSVNEESDPKLTHAHAKCGKTLTGFQEDTVVDTSLINCSTIRMTSRLTLRHGDCSNCLSCGFCGL